MLSDAMWRPSGSPHGSGTLAFVVWVPLTPRGEGKFAFAEMAAPSDLLSALMSMRAQKTFIIPLEQLALQGAYVCEELSANLRDRLVIHCADNKAANAGAIKGFSGSRDLAAIVRATRWAWRELNVDPWVEYVASGAHLSDDPSRGVVAWLLAQGACRVPGVIPGSALVMSCLDDVWRFCGGPKFCEFRRLPSGR